MKTGYTDGKRKRISKEAADVLQKIINEAELQWLFFLMVEGEYATIVDIDYENGRALQFEEGLKQLQARLTLIGKPVSAYHLTPAEIDVYHQLLQEYGVK